MVAQIGGVETEKEREVFAEFIQSGCKWRSQHWNEKKTKDGKVDYTHTHTHTWTKNIVWWGGYCTICVAVWLYIYRYRRGCLFVCDSILKWWSRWKLLTMEKKKRRKLRCGFYVHVCLRVCFGNERDVVLFVYVKY